VRKNYNPAFENKNCMEIFTNDFLSANEIARKLDHLIRRNFLQPNPKLNSEKAAKSLFASIGKGEKKIGISGAISMVYDVFPDRIDNESRLVECDSFGNLKAKPGAQKESSNLYAISQDGGFDGDICEQFICHKSSKKEYAPKWAADFKNGFIDNKIELITRTINQKLKWLSPDRQVSRDDVACFVWPVENDYDKLCSMKANQSIIAFNSNLNGHSYQIILHDLINFESKKFDEKYILPHWYVLAKEETLISKKNDDDYVCMLYDYTADRCLSYKHSNKAPIENEIEVLNRIGNTDTAKSNLPRCENIQQCHLPIRLSVFKKDELGNEKEEKSNFMAGKLGDADLSYAAENILSSEYARAIIGQDILLGVLQLHEDGLAHRDIKPANIFLTNDKKDLIKAVLGDLELANDFKSRPGNYGGTMGFIPLDALTNIVQFKYDYENLAAAQMGDAFASAITIWFLYKSWEQIIPATISNKIEKYFLLHQELSKVVFAKNSKEEKLEGIKSFGDKIKVAYEDLNNLAQQFQNGQSLANKIKKGFIPGLIEMLNPDQALRKNNLLYLLNFHVGIKLLGEMVESNHENQSIFEAILNPIVLENDKHTYIKDDNGFFATYQSADLFRIPYQGYKIHISAPETIKGMRLVANEVLPWLRKNNVNHKFVYMINKYIEMGEKSFWQDGKFITIYPTSNKEAQEILSSLHELISKSKIIDDLSFYYGLSFPSIFGEEQYKGSPVIFYRYGVLTDCKDKCYGVLRVDKLGNAIDSKGNSNFPDLGEVNITTLDPSDYILFEKLKKLGVLEPEIEGKLKP
jgi:serine/threonine protein kinase